MSRHFEKRVGNYFKSIKKHCDKIQTFGNIKGLNPFKMVQKFANDRRHPGAIEYVMSILANGKTIYTIRTNPWAYANHVMKIQNQNFNEQDAIKIHDHLKSMPLHDLSRFTHGIFKKI